MEKQQDNKRCMFCWILYGCFAISLSTDKSIILVSLSILSLNLMHGLITLSSGLTGREPGVSWRANLPPRQHRFCKVFCNLHKNACDKCPNVGA